MGEHAGYELLKRIVGTRIRILKTEGEERPDRSWQRLTCHVHREDIPWSALGLIFALGLLSFSDARPRGNSHVDYREDDDWSVADMLERLRFERGLLVFDADYVRGRMTKTEVTIHPNGHVVVETRNRHEMATRWIRLLQGKKHLQLIASRAPTEPGA